MPPVRKKPAAAKPKAAAPEGKGSAPSLWGKGEYISPVAVDAHLFEKSTLISTSGQLWTASGPLLTGELVGKIHDVFIDDQGLSLCVEVLFIEYPLVVEFLSRDAADTDQFLVWIHFCKEVPCMEVGARENRLHVQSIRKIPPDHPTSHLEALTGRKVESRGQEGVRDPGAVALQALARDMGFTGEHPPALPPAMQSTTQPSLEGPLYPVAAQPGVNEPLKGRKLLQQTLQSRILQKSSSASGDAAASSTLPLPLLTSSLPALDGTERERKHRKKKKKKRSWNSSSDSSADTSTSSSLADAQGKFRRLAQAKPGKLFMAGYREMYRLLNEKHGAGLVGPSDSSLDPLMVRYFHLILSKQGLGPRGDREVLTLCSAIDAILSGGIPGCLDILMQRIKALEATAGEELPWSVASHLEVVQDRRPTTLSRREREMAVKQQLKDLRVNKLLARQQEVVTSRRRSRSRSPFPPGRVSALSKNPDSGEARKVTFSEETKQSTSSSTKPTPQNDRKPWWNRHRRPPNQSSK